MTAESQSQQEYRFEVAIPFGSESFRNLTLLPDVLNPWRYLAKRRVQNISETTAYEQWDNWGFNTDEMVSGEFTPYVVRGRQADDRYIYEWVCKVKIPASDSDAARTGVEEGLSMVVDEFTIRPFKSQQFAYQTGRAERIV